MFDNTGDGPTDDAIGSEPTDTSHTEVPGPAGPLAPADPLLPVDPPAPAVPAEPPALPGLAGRLLAGLDPASAAAVRAAVSHERVPVDEEVTLPGWAGLPGSLALATAVA
ncbi:MAG TPA: hypothetical protein VLC50_07560, partial [Actinomycetes bacterium]|nr:hypothetical protein [Actinomycetes bacterium]